MIPILIPAAGQSRRMGGRDKLLEDVDGQPLLRLQAMRALATRNPVVVILPVGADGRQAALDGLDVQQVPVSDAADGLSASLRAGVAALPDCAGFMVTLPDLVKLETTDLRTIITAHHDKPDHLIWRGATADGQPGHPTIFDGALRPQFSNLTGDIGAAPIIKAHCAQTCLVPLPGQRARYDLDTPQDWATWRARRCQHGR